MTDSLSSPSPKTVSLTVFILSIILAVSATLNGVFILHSAGEFIVRHLHHRHHHHHHHCHWQGHKGWGQFRQEGQQHHEGPWGHAPFGNNMLTANPDQITDFKVKMLTQKLTLTDAEQAQIKPILKDEVVAEQKAKLDVHSKIKALLTPDQQKQFDEGLAPAPTAPVPPVAPAPDVKKP